MYSEERKLMKNVPILEHSTIQQEEITSVLLLMWSRWSTEANINERWIQRTANCIGTLRELIHKGEGGITSLIVKGLVSEIRHVTNEDVFAMITESMERKQLDSILRVLDLAQQDYKTTEDVYDILNMGKLVEFSSDILNTLNLREKEVQFLAAGVLMVGISEHNRSKRDYKRMETFVRAQLKNSRFYDESKEFTQDDLDELLGQSKYVTRHVIDNFSDKFKKVLQAKTEMKTLSEVVSMVNAKKDTIFEPSELREVEPTLREFPSLTDEGVIVAKVLVYTIGRMPINDRCHELERLLANYQKERSMLMFTKPGSHELTTREVDRLTELAPAFMYDTCQRMETENIQQRLLNIVDELKLLG